MSKFWNVPIEIQGFFLQRRETLPTQFANQPSYEPARFVKAVRTTLRMFCLKKGWGCGILWAKKV